MELKYQALLDENFVVFAKGKDQVSLMNTLNEKLNKINLFGLVLPMYPQDNFKYSKKK
jgi:hypothetical protein